ncbi:MAG: pentapeptide repeat-containing protein [Gammaproteobacteria bacterium]|nr:pentapeptide repeat-containing protein [Gammaproteobacteria bacterium]MDH5653748.1 pentapeptide repeat-containing protein [Gammaproteobacteria bacterium]
MSEDITKQLGELVGAANDAAKTVRNVHITFLLLCVYFGLIIASTTDVQLLKIDPVNLPLLNVKLPILEFYVITPWMLVLLHFNLLVQCYLLASKLHSFNALSEKCDDAAVLKLQRDRLWTFWLVHAIVDQQHPRLMRLFINAMMVISLIVLPLFILTWAELRFIPFHSQAITWSHRIVILVDCVLLWLIWPRIVISADEQTRWWWQLWHGLKRRIRRTPQHLSRVGVYLADKLSWRETAALVSPIDYQARGQSSLAVTSVSLFIIAWCIAAIPSSDEFGRRVDEWFMAKAFYSLSGLPFRQNLIIENQVILQGQLDTQSINALLGKNEKAKQTAMDKVIGIDLRNRDLRFALFNHCSLPKIILKGVQLQGAEFWNTQLQGANLNGAQLQSVSLRGAWLQGADLRNAQLQGAKLYETKLQGASLWGATLQGANLGFAQLQGANLVMAQLQGANLARAQLQGADLYKVQLQGADLEGAQLQGADLGGAQLQGANLQEAQLQGAYLSGAQLHGVDFSTSNLDLSWLTDVKLGGLNRVEVHTIIAAFDFMLEDNSIIDRKSIEKRISRIKRKSNRITDFRGVTAKYGLLCDQRSIPLATCISAFKRETFIQQWIDYMIRLGCSDKWIMQGISQYPLKHFTIITDDEKIMFIKGLNHNKCTGLDDKTSEKLQKILKESQRLNRK